MTRRAWVLFAAVCVLWGIPYLLIELALRGGFSPYALVCVRVAVAGAVLLALAGPRRVRAQARGKLGWLLAYALIECCLPFPAIAIGEQHVSSSVAAIVIATVPLIVTVIALRFDPSERPTRLRVIGMLVGLLGVAALVGLDLNGRSDELIGIGALLLAAVGYGAAPMILKLRLGALDARVAMGVPLVMSAVVLAPAALATWPTRAVSLGGWVSVIALALVCTAAAFVLYVLLLREAGMARAAIVTYFNPVIALLLGVTLLGERPRAGSLLGLGLILAGSYLSTGGALRGRLVRGRGRGAGAVPAEVVGAAPVANP